MKDRLSQLVVLQFLLILVTAPLCQAQNLDQYGVQSGEKYIYGVYNNLFESKYHIIPNGDIVVDENDSFVVTIQSTPEKGKYSISIDQDGTIEKTDQFLGQIGAFAISTDWDFWKSVNHTVLFRNNDYLIQQYQTSKIFTFDLNAIDFDVPNYTISYYKDMGIIESITKIQGNTTLLIENQMSSITSDNELHSISGFHIVIFLSIIFVIRISYIDCS